MIFFLAAIPQKNFANVTVTAPSLTMYACGGTFPTTSYTLGNIVIKENANNDISTFGTLILSAPANFEFTSAGTGSRTGGNVSGVSVVLTNATTITVSITGSGTNSLDVITLSGIQVRGINAVTTSATVTRTGGTSVVSGDANGTVHATLTSASQSIPTVTSSSTGSVCSGVAQNYTITSNLSGTTYNWSRAAVTGITNAAASNQTTNPITETLVNNTASPVNVTYIITPTINGCSGSFNYVVTVNPTPTLSSSLTQTRCSNISTTYTATSATTGTTYTWTRAAAIGISNAAASGSGAVITETLVNTTGLPVNVTYVVTLTANGCSNSQNVTVTVKPIATLASALIQTRCNSLLTSYTTLSSTIGATYTWTRAAVTGVDNASASGIGPTISEMLVNSSANPVDVVYVVTTTANGCSNAQNVTITVNPTPTLSSSLTQSRCNATSATYTSTSATTGTTYTWTRAAVAGVSNASASGSGAAITENLVNTTTNPVDVTYTITLSANGCTNTQNVTVTVNPTPTLSSTLTPAAICSNTTFSYTATGTIAGTTYTWTRAAIAGISNAAASGSGSSIIETLINTTASPVNVVYVVTSTANGCSNPQNVTVTVNPSPTLSSSLTQNRCNAVSANYTATSATTGTTYSWSRAAVTGISNAATSSSGASITETLVNTTASPIDVIYVFTLSANGCSNTQNVTVTINPIPTLNSSLTQTRCSNTSTTYTATSTTTGTSYTWTRAAVTGISNVAASGSGASITETLLNTTLNPVNVVYVITLTINGCSNMQNVTVTVNPSPTLSSTLTPAAICNNTAFNYTATSALAGTTYTWSRAAVAGISNAASNGSDASITESLINTTANPLSVIYAVTLSANGCSNTQNVTVTVNPTPILSSALTPSRCNNTSTTYTATSATSGTIYTWSRAVAAGISNAAASGSGASITETLVNTTANPVDITYVITLTANGCTNTQNVTVTVNPTPTLSSTLTPATICSNTTFSYTAISTTTGITYTWARAAVTGISNAASSGNGASISETLINTTASPVNVVYVVTSTINGCSNAQNVTVTVNPAPTISTAAAATSVCASTTAQTTSLTYSGTTGAPSTYSITWDVLGTAAGFAAVTNAALPTGAITISVPANAGAATYTGTITVKNGNGCVSTGANFFLTINPLPVITPAVRATAVCFSTSAQSSALTYTSSNSPTTYSIVWSASAIAAGFAGITDAALPTSPITLFVPANAAPNVYAATITVKNANGCKSSAPKSFSITINPLPTVTPEASAENVCYSTSAQTTSLDYTSTNSPTTYSITWNTAAIAAGFSAINNATLPSSGPILLNVPAGAPVNSYIGTLTVRTANRCVSSTGANFIVTVNPLPQGSLAANGPFCATGTGQLTWTASSGTGPFSIIYNDGTDNRTQNNVTSGVPFDVFTNAVTSTTTYTLVSVTDNNGCGRSAGFAGNSATINVNNPPSITTQPASQISCATFPASFSVSAIGDGLTYQWFKGSTPLSDNSFITGSTNASITINPVKVTDAGTYHVVVSGQSPCTSAVSNDVTLDVIQEFNITTQPVATQTVCETNTATFSIVATGSNLTYQWRKGTTNLIDGGNISGSTSSTLTISNVTTANATTASEKYNVVISKVGGTCSTAFSNTASLIVNTNSTLSLSSASASQTVCINNALTNISYTIGGGGTGASITGGSLPAGVTGSFSAGIFTISGTPTVSGVFNYTITTSGPCTNVSLSGTITVNASSSVTLSSAAGTNSQNICRTSAITNITYLMGGSATGATITGLPSGVTGSYNSGTNTFTISGTPSTSGTFNYTITSTGPCVQTAVGSITVAPASVGGTLSPASTYTCSGTNTGTITLTGKTGNVIRWESSINGGDTWTSITNTTTTLTYTNLTQSTIYRAVVQSGICSISYSSNAAVGMNPLVTPSVTASPSVMCLGESSTLNATINYPAADPLPLETFALANPADWTGNSADNNNASPNSTWGETNNGKVFNGVTYNSNAAPTDKMMIVNGTTGVAGNTAILGTPAFSLVGLSSATLKWYQAFNLNAGTVAKVEISTNGGTTYVPLVTYNGASNFGVPNNGFVQVSIPLTGYIGMSNLKIRFYYLGTAGSNWAIDNVEIVAIHQSITYSWSPTTYLSPTSGSTVTATPTIAGTFPYTLTVSGGSCVLGSSTVNVTVSSSPTISLGTNPSVCQKTTSASLPYTIISGAPNKYSIVYDADALAAGFVNVTNAFLPASPVTLVIPSAANAGVYNGVLTVNKDGGISCPNSSIPFTVTIKPKPSIGSQAVGICTGSAFTISPTNSNGNVVPAGTTYTWAAPVVTGGITGGSSQSTPQSVIGQTLTNPTNSVQTATYTVTPVSAGCTGLPFTLTVTVNPIPVVTSTTGDNGCGSGSVTLEGTANTGTLNWYANESGGSILGTGLSFTTPSISSTTTFYAEATYAGCTSPRVPVQATVNALAVITANPQSVSLCPQPFSSLSATFTVNATNAAGYQWQVSTNSGSTWSNVAEGVTYSDVNTNTLTINGISESMEGYQYRNVVNNLAFCSPVYSLPATLIITNVWKGITSSNWSTASNWWGDVVPDINCEYVIVPNVSPKPFPILSGTETQEVRNIVIRKNASVKITQSSTLQIRGVIYADMNNSSYGTLDGTDGRVELTGGNLQSYGDDATQFIAGSLFYKRTLKDLRISNPLNVTVSSAFKDTLNITGHLSFGNVTDVTLFTGDNITLKSSSAGTASVDEIQVDGSGTALNYISGKAIVERYIPAHRAWRLLTIPVVNDTLSINEAWQEGVVNSTLTYPGGNTNPNPGYGTHITGMDRTTDFNIGYDAGPQNNFSLKVHDHTRRTTPIDGYQGLQHLYPGKGTNNTPIDFLQGYMLFVRGDRSINMNLNTAAAPTETVLRAQGILKTGTQPGIPTNDTFNVIGNPFAATIDMRKIIKTGGGSEFFYLYDTRLGSIGAFQTFSKNASGNYVPLPGGGSYSAPYGNTSSYNYIQSGQAFFVQSFGAGSVIIKEDAKNLTTNSMIFSPVTKDQELRTNLYAVNTSPALLDATITNFSSNGNNGLDAKDAIKISNISGGTYLGMQREGKNLVIERRHTVNSSDTIFYNLMTPSKRNYRFEFIGENIDSNKVNTFLEDAYLKTVTPVNLNDTATVDFTVNTDSASSAPNRFRLVFVAKIPPLPLPVTFRKLKANKQNDDIAVEWLTENEQNIESYEIESSVGGRQFVKAVSLKAKGSSSNENYQWIDINARPGVHYYRVRGIDKDGGVTYSNTVSVAIEPGKSAISVYPNPVLDKKINVHFINQLRGNYLIRLIDNAGHVLSKKEAYITDSKVVQMVKADNNVLPGVYKLEIIGPDNTITTINLILK